MPERRFTEQQVADIIRKATEAQSVRRSAQGESGAISASEIRRIGAELGIDPEAIEEAMGKAVTWTTVESGSEFPAQRFYERRIPGPLSVACFADVMGALAPSRWLSSVSVRADGVLTYKAIVGVTSCAVTLTNYGQESRLRVRCSAAGAWVVTVVIGFILWLLYLLAAPSMHNLHAFMALPWYVYLYSMLLIGGSAYWCTSWLTRFSHRKLTRLMDEVANNLYERTLAQPSGERLSSQLSEPVRLPGEEETRLGQRLGGT